MLAVLQKIMSHVWPIKMAEYTSEHSGQLELIMHRGQLLLDTQSANYSYGNLHHVMQAGISHAIAKGIDCKKALILGFGAGDAAAILRKNYLNTQIDGVELDPVVINIYQQHFTNVGAQLHQGGALEYLESNELKYDIIICDVFINLGKPSFTQTTEYYSLIKKALTTEGIFMQNGMGTKSEATAQFNVFASIFPQAQMQKVLQSNYLYFS
jgi:spermidine synthase